MRGIHLPGPVFGCLMGTSGRECCTFDLDTAEWQCCSDINKRQERGQGVKMQNAFTSVPSPTPSELPEH